ncbi:non-heme iron oxygenase ferredoxin subunit [Marinobacterium arenosum]|uniref:non-heme iron oxygenase ferredoxin subunit n=1 Tax=Marinobacterium arenosum TaxID=2862496 RepID=UPI001C947002|nr:non-heme iron oxygenase ferredoxin subunit [Marinobacterium arenosum]MBY4678859.1 non-heme iron oxygenase ferredoxin subunit [Marinobacterium arenosum]
MTQWRDICEVAEIGVGDHRVVRVDGDSLLLVNLGGCFYAVENICTHDGGELGGGLIENDTVTCPRHGACFCLKTGKVLKPPAFEDLRCYPVRIEQGWVQIGDKPIE